MPIRWRKDRPGQEVEAIFRQLNRERKQESGKISYVGFSALDIDCVIRSFLDFPTDAIEHNCRRAVWKVMTVVTLDGRLNPLEFPSMVQKAYEHLLGSPRTEFMIVSNWIATGTFPLSKVAIDECRISFSKPRNATRIEAVRMAETEPISRQLRDSD